MFQARAIALRSADWARQVGAVIASQEGSVIAVGRNDYPRVGGGVVSDREHKDSALRYKNELVREFLSRISDWLPEEKWKDGSGAEAAQTIRELMDVRLKSTRILGLGEFQRMVHAEMAAIVDAAARGVPVRDQVMFCTTFPCQNCAKHIMAAGIRTVVHIEPYPKSLVLDLFEEETCQLVLEPLNSPEYAKQLEENRGKLLLVNFMGVAPRRYESIFSMPVREGESGEIFAWDRKTAEPRLDTPLEVDEYGQWELDEAAALEPVMRPH